MSKLIEVDGLVYDYVSEGVEKTRHRALEGIDLNVNAGEFVVVMGMNGSGKSTLAKCLNGLFVPTEGRVLVDGLDTAEDERIWEVRSTAGMVFQNPDNQLVSSMVEDDIAFGPENLGIPSDELRVRVDRAMDAVGIRALARRGVHLLSGGQKQRVAIAGVLAMEPKCIIFDESTAMLDPRGRAEVLEIIEKLNGEGIATVLITHYMDEAVRADRIVIMKDGNVMADDAPAAVFAQTDLLAACGLDLPPAVKMREMLRAQGVPVPAGILEIRALAEWLVEQGGRNAH